MPKPSPRFIGAFVTAALALLVGMVLFFGSSSWLSQSSQFILFFDQSVNGLNEGSTVKFRGVPVGSVERIMIRAEGQDPDSTAIPVLIRIDQTRLENDLGVAETVLQPKSIQSSIDRGLFAELGLESFITGQLFVELSFDADRKPDFEAHRLEASEIMEIPTVSSSLDEITADAATIIAKLSTLDFQRLNDNINAVLENLAIMVEGIDSPEISRAIAKAADSVADFVESDDLNAAIKSTNEALQQVAATVQTLNLDEGALGETLDAWTAKLARSLEGLDEVSRQISSMTEPDGSFRYEFESMLRELSRAARSMRELTDFLEANPNAILTGRPEK